MRNLTLAEKNSLYQHRHRAKLRQEIGNNEFLQEKRDYMRTYRDAWNHAEGYVKPPPVVRIAEPVCKPPVKIREEIVLKQIDRNQKKTKKQESRIELMKLKLKSKALAPKTLAGYIGKHQVIYRDITGDRETEIGGWKAEVEKALKNQAYDEGLIDALSYFRNLGIFARQVFIIRQYFQSKCGGCNIYIYIYIYTYISYTYMYKNVCIYTYDKYMNVCVRMSHVHVHVNLF